MTFSLSHWGMFIVSEADKNAWALALFWEEVCHKPRGSFRGVHGNVPCFEIENLE